ncbi:MAG: hypothetical protein ABR910_00900 [Acidobacteriaceae bacterium]|jgi:hypothetical protein
MASGLIGLLESGASSNALAERLMAILGKNDVADALGPAQGAHDSQSFWDSFGTAADSANAPPSGVHGRGLFKKPAADGSSNTAPGRLVDYYHYYTDPKTKQTSLRQATSITTEELLDHPGDITASVAVNGFRMAGDDRQTFDQLQSAQLRIDVVQAQSLMPEYLDTMAWMSLAGLFPDKTGKLPPLEDLSFDPATSAQKTKQMVLPGGSGQMAVNLSMTHKDSLLFTIIKNLNTEVGRFAPLIGLPAISVSALKGFCTLYGAMEQRTTFLLNSMPRPAYATQLARQLAQTSQGLNLVAGDYVLVPNSFSAELTPYLDKLDLQQGYLVPKGSPSTASVYDLAAALKPDITYLSASIGLKPLAAGTAAPASTSTSRWSFPSSPAPAAGDSGSGSSTPAPAKASTGTGKKPGA